MQSITACLESWADCQPEQPLFGFIGADGEAGDGYTYRAFLERTRALAAKLGARERLVAGERVLLAYPPGLELLVAFFACARLGVIPVPVAPPDALNFSAAMRTLGLIARDCGAVMVLSCAALRDLVASRAGLAARPAFEPVSDAAPKVEGEAADEAASRLDWVATDGPLDHRAGPVGDAAGPILFLQYTSGSTGAPRGVVVGHRNVIHNARATLDHAAVGVSWLPQYHDMGLIGYGLFPVVCGGASYGMAPLDFLKRPALWLQAISRLRATYASSPNFGFEYCLRPGRIGADEMRGVDLGSLRVLMNAAEPARPEIRQRFIERFAPHGLRADACVVAYGLAEHTLAATHHGRRSLALDQAALRHQSVRLADPASAAQVRVASCGRALGGVRLRIVEPLARRVLGERRIGEIWLAGDSVCQGYWGHGGAGDVFGQRLADDAGEVVDDGGRPHAYLRTGDLGFIDDGELFVCGRSKDLIIVRGVNHYPQDIEAAVEAALPAIRPGAVAAFNGADASLVLLIEVRRRAALPDPETIACALRRRCLVGPDIIVFASPRAIARTTSGKLARQLTRARWLSGQVDCLQTWRAPAAPAPLRQRCAALLAQLGACAPDATLAELGLDSLMMTELLLDIEQTLRERGAARLAGELDATLLQRLSLARFAALLDCVEDGGADALDALALELGQARGAFERDIGARMRRDAGLGPFDCAARAPDAAVREVLLTGATGFFGPFLLKSLLERGDCRYHVLVRAPDADSALRRLHGALERAGLLTAALQAALADRVRVIRGDLSRERLGLAGFDYERLARQVDAVVHNAAAVNYVANYEALKPHNVDATRALLNFAATERPKRFHHISSTFIFGWTARGLLPESDNNADMAHLDFGYAQTKWVAEQLVLAARARGLDARIYRPALLSVSSGAAGDCDDVAVRLLAFMIRHGVAVDSANQLSIMAADVAADNIAAIVGRPEVAGGTFHVTVDAYYNMADMTRVLSREHGYAFTYYDIPGFIAQMNLRCTRADPLYALLDFFNRSAPKIAAMQLKRYGSADYRAARAGAGGVRPDLGLEQTVACLVAYLRGAGMIGPPGKGGGDGTTQAGR